MNVIENVGHLSLFHMLSIGDQLTVLRFLSVQNLTFLASLSDAGQFIQLASLVEVKHF